MGVMGQFYLGCAVWAFADWVGSFYPAATPPRQFLACYGERLNAVEGNTTFYSVPSAATVERWRSQTPPEFRFCPKFPQTVTHQGALLPQLPQAVQFIERMQGLRDRLGPLLLQLPPRYSPEQAQDLLAFLAKLPRQEVAIALEVRHLQWFTPTIREQLNADLAALQVGRALLDTRSVYSTTDDPQKASRNRKPKLPLWPDCPNKIAFVRFISHPDTQFHEPFFSEWLNQVAAWLTAGKTVYFFVHCPAEIHSPHTAMRFFQALKTRYPVSLPSPERPPEQLSLF